ncbi:hypothetical protein LCGC14_0898230 [marine sediment metagenome]|uniref:Uncharacterized protein n=1 Tax=marine sediment metagenome TaxID=412755 RepID=A0A0F9S422_9ZZZZ
MASAHLVELDDIHGPNLVPIEAWGETGSAVKVDLEWNVPVPEGGFDKYIVNGEVMATRRMTLERAQEWLDILSAQLERARATRGRLRG